MNTHLGKSNDLQNLEFLRHELIILTDTLMFPFGLQPGRKARRLYPKGNNSISEHDELFRKIRTALQNVPRGAGYRCDFVITTLTKLSRFLNPFTAEFYLPKFLPKLPSVQECQAMIDRLHEAKDYTDLMLMDAKGGNPSDLIERGFTLPDRLQSIVDTIAGQKEFDTAKKIAIALDRSNDGHFRDDMSSLKQMGRIATIGGKYIVTKNN